MAIFWAILAIFGVFGGFVGDWGVLGVLVTYMITRGIKLVVGRFTEGVKRGLRGFWGFLVRSRGSRGFCLTPLGHVLPLWKSCGALDLGPNTT